MGHHKKRSKTAKQLQNKAVKKCANAFAKKLGISAEASSASSPLYSNERTPKQAVPHKTKRTTKPTKWRKKQQPQQPQQQQQQQQTKVAGIASQETLEFTKDQAAVQERHEIVEWKRKHGAKTNKNNNNNKKKTKRQRSKQQQQQQQQQQALGFAAPTFCLLPHQKSTPALIQETTQKVQATNVFGSTYDVASSLPSSSTLLPCWNESSDKNNDNKGNNKDATTTTIKTKNPFAVLQDNDDDDDDEMAQTTTTTTTTTTLFSFAPPSFFLPEEAAAAASTSIKTAVDTTRFDPDL